jgi:hypothetical protein
MSPATPVVPVQTPLTAILPIKSPQDYLALTVVLPKAAPAIEAALNKISTVHFARFVFLANNTQLAIITTYDGDFARYIGDFAREMGGVFDMLFQHIADAPPLPVLKNIDAFVKYVADHDVKPASFYSAYPTLTVVTIKSR